MLQERRKNNDSVVENGVEVTYSSDCELFLMDTETGEYDAKIDVYSNHIETYVSKDSYWEEHDHYHTDDEGILKRYMVWKQESGKIPVGVSYL